MTIHVSIRNGRLSAAVFAALSVCMASSPAAAQTAPTPAQGAAVESTPDSSDIVVTAQRRSERLTDVPVSVTALTAETIVNSGVTDTYSLQQITPGLRMERLGGYTQPSIRGVTAGSTNPGSEANVAIYVDGIYQPNQAANTIDLPDVARVEVSKGPQGTLFGRNATGGAIQIFTREPEYKPSVDMQVGYGSYNDLAVKAFVTAPLIADKLAFSVSGSYEDMDGWNHDLLNGGHVGDIKSRLIRGKLLFEPTDNVKFVLGGQYSRRSDDSLFAYSALNGNTIGPKTAVVPYDVAVNTKPLTNTESYNISLRGSVNTQVGTISSLTAFAKTQLDIAADGDASPAQIISFTIDSPDKNFTQELNFASEKFGRFSFIAGLFYYRDDSSYDPLIGFFPAPFINYANVTTRAYAAYTEGTFQITDKLTAIAGIRYSHEKRTVQYVGGDAATFVGTALHEKSYNAATPRLSLRYEFEPRTDIYATYSKGFKSGVYDLNGTATTPVNPEKIDAYEVGFKTSRGLFDLNLAGYYYKYSNLQVQINSGGFDLLTNAGAARNYGFDVEGAIRPTHDLRFSGGFTYLHARYHDYTTASILVPIAGGGNATVSGVDLSGFKVTRAPSWTLNLGVNYEHEFDIGTVGLSGNLYHTDDVPLEQSGRVQQKAYTLVNSTLTFKPANTNFRFSVWGKNLTDEKVIQGSFFTGAGDQVSYAPPRTFGGSIGYAF
ncbi:MAG: TonB-dependent receptor [Sphingomonadales bacterium]|nr:TonB-dependent receptor [Sphingomonadales bacterium]